MVSKSLTNFANLALAEIEKINNTQQNLPSDSFEQNENVDLNYLKNYKKSWCSTLDRAYGFAFKSFCRFVVHQTLSDSYLRKRSEITSDDILDTIYNNFYHRETESVPPLPDYYKFYSKYAAWYNWKLNCDKLYRVRKGCNMSHLRKLSLPKTKVQSNREEPVEFGKYELVEPKAKFKTPSLSTIFG